MLKNIIFIVVAFIAVDSWAHTKPDCQPFTKVGIGIVLEKTNDNKIIINGFVPGAPADGSLIKAGDEIQAITPSPVAMSINLNGLTLDQVVALIRGEEGVPVRLDLLHGNTPVSITLIRKKITIDC